MSGAARLVGLAGGDPRGMRALARARIVAALGDLDEATALLRDELSRRPLSILFGYTLHADAGLAPLRAYPPARELLGPSR